MDPEVDGATTIDEKSGDDAKTGGSTTTYAISASGDPTWISFDDPEVKEQDEQDGMIPTTFGELAEFDEAVREDRKLTGFVYDFFHLAGNVIALGGDKQAGLYELAKEMTKLLKGKEITDPADLDCKIKTNKEYKQALEQLGTKSFIVWKQENGTWRWMGIYSNKFRDDDHPVNEILSEKSHIEFISRVTKGEIEYPDLYVWHIQVPVGKADLLAYDDSGFSVALGYFNSKSNRIAQALQKTETNLAMSHGMPSEFIERDKDDSTVITRYVSSEVSVLSQDAAANKLTHFSILKSKEDKNMSIAPELRTQIVQMMGEDATADLEGQLAAQADKAIKEGVEFKSAGEGAVADTTPVTKPAPDATPEPVADVKPKSKEEPVTEEPAGKPAGEAGEGEGEGEGDVAAAAATANADATIDPVVTALKEELTGVLADIVKAIDGNTKVISERLDALESKVGELEKDENEKLADKAAGMTTASIASLLAQQLTGGPAQSVIGQSATHVHGNSSLAKDGPAEVDPEESEKQEGLFFHTWASGNQS